MLLLFFTSFKTGKRGVRRTGLAFAGREPRLPLPSLLTDAKELSPRKGEKTEPAAARKNTLDSVHLLC